MGQAGKPGEWSSQGRSKALADSNAPLPNHQEEKEKEVPQSNMSHQPNSTHLRATAGILWDSYLSKVREQSLTSFSKAPLV